MPGAGTGSSVALDYLNLTGVYHQGEARFNPLPGLTAKSVYDYDAANKCMNSDDPSKTDESRLGYFRVVRRFDDVPAIDAPGTPPATKREGEAEFAYTGWDQSARSYGCTRTARRAAGEAGIAPAGESWQFDRQQAPADRARDHRGEQR